MICSPIRIKGGSIAPFLSLNLSSPLYFKGDGTDGHSERRQKHISHPLWCKNKAGSQRKRMIFHTVNHQNKEDVLFNSDIRVPLELQILENKKKICSPIQREWDKNLNPTPTLILNIRWRWKVGVKEEQRGKNMPAMCVKCCLYTHPKCYQTSNRQFDYWLSKLDPDFHMKDKNSFFVDKVR